MKIIYETERLKVRTWVDSDYKDLYDYASRDEVTQFLSFDTYRTYDDAMERINYLKQQYSEEKTTVDYAIELKSEKKVIGSIGVVGYKENGTGEIEIGYILNPDYQGNGYMTEALKGMFKYIKQKSIAKRIILKHDTLNVKSGNVMKRAGMTFEGILRRAGNSNHIHDRYDIALYSILDEEIEM